MHKILLTGSSGFIGSNILNNFSKKNKFYLILRKKPNKKILKNKNIKIIKIRNHESLNDKLKKIKVDIVIHCATHYVKSHNFSDIKKFCYSNILLGNVILENLDNMKVKKFINFSTVWEDFPIFLLGTLPMGYPGPNLHPYEVHVEGPGEGQGTSACKLTTRDGEQHVPEPGREKAEAKPGRTGPGQ